MVRFKIFFAALFILITACSGKKNNNIEDLGRVKVNADLAVVNSGNSRDEDMPVEKHEAFTGTVVETIDVEHYTYIKFRDDFKKEHWAAVFKGSYIDGSNITIESSVIMKNFNSPTLNRTFDEIIFGGVTKVDGKSVEPSQDPRETEQGADKKLPAGHPPI
ncbi:MAG: hypothetical protein JXR91_12570 [Deltaproteobacteria bacterium]|nr:hypothetical protein [Deltaproteobacteria bacterium]